jgi:hypothetical protein
LVEIVASAGEVGELSPVGSNLVTAAIAGAAD